MRFRDKTTRRLVLLGVVGALVVGALALPALAQNATEATSEATPSPDLRLDDRRSAFAAALAEELDLPVDQVTDAITAAHEKLAEQWMDERTAALRERLDQAVAAGQLTQEQADAIIAAVEAGVLPGGPGLGEHRLEFGDRGPGFRHRGMMEGLPFWDVIPEDDSAT